VYGQIVSFTLQSLAIILAKQHCDRIAHTWSTTSATKLLLVLIGVKGTGWHKSRMRQYGILETQFVLAHHCIIVVDQVDAPPKGRWRRVWWVGYQQLSPRMCLLWNANIYKTAPESKLTKKNWIITAPEKASWKRVRGFTIIPHIWHHCAQGTLEPVISLLLGCPH
jgi:hypothetical protein